MRKKHLLILIGIALCMALSGCGKQTLQEVSDSVPSETEQSISDEGASKHTEEKHGEIIFEEAPEGYVYDYQVSLEPIPKEIADLGNPCQGTIHAFPSRIRIGLTEKMMEEDAELKAEVEKRIAEVEECLKENIGGEFRVDGVDAVNESMIWYFLCTEVGTGYQFDIAYLNNEFYYIRNNYEGGLDNRIYLEDYYDQIKTTEVEQIYQDIINEYFEGCVCKVWVQSGVDVICIDIMQFTDGEIKKAEEQLKILNFWKALREIGKEKWYRIDIKYFPTEYKELMGKKCNEGISYDVYIEYDSKLLANQELKEAFSYDSEFNADDKYNLDNILDLYENGKYDEKEIWSYWSVAE